MLLGSHIIKGYENGDIVISPFNADHVGPNSYDVMLGDELLVYDMDQICCGGTRGGVLDVKVNNVTKRLKIPTDDGIVLYPGVLYLGHTVEKAGSQKYIPMYEGRSSMARLGIRSYNNPSR